MSAIPTFAIPTAAGMQGVTRKPCPRFATDQGCPHLGGSASTNIPGNAQGFVSFVVALITTLDNAEDLEQ
eukprot:4482029-Prorocentrum_lima.AAC.1